MKLQCTLCFACLLTKILKKNEDVTVNGCAEGICVM